jgi:hypothetical protein
MVVLEPGELTSFQKVIHVYNIYTPSTIPRRKSCGFVNLWRRLILKRLGLSGVLRQLCPISCRARSKTRRARPKKRQIRWNKNMAMTPVTCGVCMLWTTHIGRIVRASSGGQERGGG